MSARVLITGASGFAGRHLLAACAEAGDEVTAVGRRRHGDGPAQWLTADLRDGGQARRAVEQAAPEVVYHLAALASVARSWEDPETTMRGNYETALNLLEAVRAVAPDARVVLIGSGEVYGRPDSLPVEESARLAPVNPYAISKAAVDLLGGMYASAHGLDVIRTRSFNHAGPGQSPIYAIAAFTRQLAAGELAGDDPIRIATGNPDSRRDFTDVRDVVRAYRELAHRAAAGVYNVCSGRSISVAEIVALLAALSEAAVEHEVDEGLVRPNDVDEVRGSAARVHEATGWEPRIPLERTLADTVVWWRAELADGA